MRHNILGTSIVGRAMEILLVEDDLDDARAVLSVLEKGNVRCRVSLVRDGEEALAFLSRRGIFVRAPRPDLILLDMVLPKKDGRRVLSEIETDEDLRSVPIVILSIASDYQSVLETENLRVIDYMSKPLDAPRFVTMVKSLHFSLLTELVLAGTRA